MKMLVSGSTVRPGRRQERWRVLFLFHGGTIGMRLKVKGEHHYLVPPEDAEDFRAACESSLACFHGALDITFEYVTAKDSTNVVPDDWERLAMRVERAQDEEGYDAVAIAHGTDTLGYSATALALALNGPGPETRWLKIPVVLTGAQNTIYQVGGDGRFNLENQFRTVLAALEAGVADVLVNFWHRVLLGCRTTKVTERNFDAMRSPAFADVGVIDAFGVHLDKALLARRPEGNEWSSSLAPKFGRGLLALEVAPGLEPDLLRRMLGAGGISSLILKSLGEGNVCSKGTFSLVPVVEYATRELRIPVFMTSQFSGGSASGEHYEVGVAAVEAGAIPCYDHTSIASEVKVRWLMGNGLCTTIEDYTRAMATNFAGEVTLS
ncbi:MAG: asparaginase [Bdellovibrionales bacterium]|nr:asparaginase [Bdellovibrionales bacterium]